MPRRGSSKPPAEPVVKPYGCDFEWLYGKLEPGIYYIVKTVTDFRGTGDYTDYTYTAEICI